MNTETGRIVTMEELKSCPFCGGEAELCRIFGRIGIACKECNVGVRSEHICAEAGHDSIFTAWNTRADEKQIAQLQAEVKRLEGELAAYRDKRAVDGLNGRMWDAGKHLAAEKKIEALKENDTTGTHNR